MKDFMHRTISEEIDVPMGEGKVGKISITRTRTTNGGASISIDFNGQRIDFRGDGYEDHAFQLASALLLVCNDPCMLPK